MKNQIPSLTSDDIYLFNEGRHFKLYEILGAHLATFNNAYGAFFAVWAPNASKVSVIGDFNGWNPDANFLLHHEQSGIWSGFITGVKQGDLYKFHILSNYNEYQVSKSDPYAFFAEHSPQNASIVWDLTYEWHDQEWMTKRSHKQNFSAPMAIYEVHIGSWARKKDNVKQFLSYRDLAVKLPAYIKDLGFTHVEFLPVMEHPFYGSWGYQTTGYFAPSSRFGNPQDFMYLIDSLHQAEIGVILDFVPSHFPNDSFGLAFFDGTWLYEHQDERLGYHPDWKSHIFNYGRNEVRGFLINSALFWLEKYHVDGLRVDAVASMLYLDYSRKTGEWIPNQFGGRENLQAIDFLRELNSTVYNLFPDVQTIAEESTAWPMVSRPSYVGGLGFGMKWDMGWMHDTLNYFKLDPLFRRYHQGELIFRMIYAFNENFVLPLSHDEVVYGKGSLISMMPGDEWQKFANLRILYAYMYSQPGKKLLFMGSELAQWQEWTHESALNWQLLLQPNHSGIFKLLKDLNNIYCHEICLHTGDFFPEGFEWLDYADVENSVFSYFRHGKEDNSLLLAVFNMTPIPRHNYRLGVQREGWWQEILNTDSLHYGGSGQGNFGGAETSPVPSHGRLFSLNLTLPPLSSLYLKWIRHD